MTLASVYGYSAGLTFFVRVMFLLCLSLTAKADDVQVPEELQMDESLLVLNGSGLRSRMFIDLYVGSLYLPNEAHDAASIIISDEPMAIRLAIVSSLITSEKLRDATLEGFENAVSDTSPLDERISRFLSAFGDVVNVGDLFQLAWNSKSGMLEVHRNEQLVEQIEGLDFKQALFAIWLGDNPVQESLKDELLGLVD